MSLTAYLPQDRLRALSRGETLPDRTTGSVLLADISGFTPLTENLQKTLGPRQGAEELTRYLNAVFSALIADVERFEGSVLSFAGDSIICWFDQSGGDATARAAAAAFAMQSAMKAFAAIRLPDGAATTLTLKTAIASGAARRFVVGDPAIQLLDVLAGAAVERAAAGEQLANPGEILLDEATADRLGPSLEVHAWRSDPVRGERFAVAAAWSGGVAAFGLPSERNSPPAGQLRAWLPAALHRGEQGGFTAGFRPCVVLFVRFGGIDYDREEARTDLDAFVAALQACAAQYEGTLMQLTFGDKGSYAYINFGALVIHEDDPRRAVKAAAALRAGTDLPIQVGIARGVMHVGAYGSETRKTYGALGDDVNTAARLMTIASQGEILVTGAIHNATSGEFDYEPHAPLRIKGKSEPLTVFTMTGGRRRRAVRLQEPVYALPMVGRERELALISQKLELAAAGRGQVIGIVADAGLGKSRLTAEAIRTARRKGFNGFGGACQSDGVLTPYLAWKSVWGAFFDVDPEMPQRRLLRSLEGEIEDRAPDRVHALPLLSAVLDLELPENDFTRNLEPKIRQSALHALLEDCLKSQAQEAPILIVIEDAHWIDSLSDYLLMQLARAMADSAVCFVLAYRSPQLERFSAQRIEALPQFTRIELNELSKDEGESVIRAKLAQLYPARSGFQLPEGLVEALMARSQGNPFYLEELLNYVRDRGFDPADIRKIELPDSLHALILSRIDQLDEQERATLRVASIIGRRFRADWLTGYYPALGTFQQVKDSLQHLQALDITPLDTPEPELAHLFKHIVIHEVTYESLPYATRADLHEQLARYLEKDIESGTVNAAPLLETLAFHYGRSNNSGKQLEYLRKVGEAAQKNFANSSALDYYGTLLDRLAAGQEKIDIHLKRGQVFELMGRYDEAESEFLAAWTLADDDPRWKAAAGIALGKLNRQRGEYESALAWLLQSEQACAALEDQTGLAQVLIETGMVLFRKGEFDQSRAPFRQGLELARSAGNIPEAALALTGLGNISNSQGDYAAARSLYLEGLGLFREAGDKWGVSMLLNNLGNLMLVRGDYQAARALYEESLSLKREMDDKWGIAGALNNLGIVAQAQEDFHTAGLLQKESLRLRREMGDKWGTAGALNNLAVVVLIQGDSAAARALEEESLALAKEMDDKSTMAYALLGLGLVALVENPADAREYILESLRLRTESGGQLGQTSSLIGAAGLALKQGAYALAAQLLGAVDAAVKAMDCLIEPELMYFYAETLAGSRASLGESAFRSAWEQGEQWRLEEAVAKVLSGE